MPAASRPEDPGSTRGAPRSAGSAPRGFGQLALELDLVAGEPRLPADIRPMQPRPVSRLPDDGRHLYDPSWGGVRVLAFVQSGTVRLLAARGRDLTARVPEVVEGLIQAAGGAGPCLFDGELVAPDAGGRLDRGVLAARLGRSRRAADRRAITPSASLLVADVLVAAGRSRLARPLTERREVLAGLLRRVPHVMILAPHPGPPQEMLAAARSMGLAAVLAKEARGPYLPGVRSRLWLRLAVGGGREAAAATAVGEDSGTARRRPDLVAMLRLPFE